MNEGCQQINQFICEVIREFLHFNHPLMSFFAIMFEIINSP